jgi:multiple sugar transport system ATP-binding protein
VRPENISIEAGQDGFAGTVSVVEPTGADTLVFARIGNVDICAMFRERHDFKPGESVRFAFDPAHLHVFDAVTGARVN